MIIIALNKQIHIYSIDTGAFYNEKELKVYARLEKLYKFRQTLKRIKNNKNTKNNEKYFKKVLKYNKNNNKRIDKRKEQLCEIFKSNEDIRILRKEKLNKYNIVSMFESSLTRIMKIPINSLSEELIIVKAYFFDILKDIIIKGFMYNNEKYVCLTASAGQIRKKKTVFIKENLLNKYINTITCGLTLEYINKCGGINVNKYLAYTALSNSATDLWEDFDITKTIVVDDMETNVVGEVDLISDKDYTVTRTKMPIPIPHTDGCGMMLESVSKKNKMFRSPWIKGLLIIFPFDKFIRKANENEENINHAIVTDIYGEKHDILEEDIRIIFTKSQFKAYKYYNSWQQYQENFIKYNCQASTCNEEDDEFDYAKINYQMLQTLTDITDEELNIICENTNNDIKNIGSDINTMLKVLGVSTHNTNKNFLQKSLNLYPEMLQDSYCKEVIRQVKKSIVKQARYARINIKGIYSFISPDLYAFCEFLFLHKKNPKGLLDNGEVFCKIFKDSKKLDCLRSPHLYCEHAVRTNVVDKEKSDWFVTNALYTSCHDLISKILMFDVDGDKSLICADETIIGVAERNVKDKRIVPLYYNMKKAEPTIINPENIYNGLQLAYKGGNIGLYSNNITKIWNSNDDIGDMEEKLKVIKLLCMENNFTIDFAKTLYKPIRPKKIDKIISKYTKLKVPHFFIYAKDKNLNQVSSLGNGVIDRLEKIIPNPNINFKKLQLDKFNYKILMNNTKISVNENIIKKYKELDLKKPFLINRDDEEKSNIFYIYKDIKEQLIIIGKREIQNLNNKKLINKLNNSSDEEKIIIIEKYITDVLIKYLYDDKNTKFKTTLWECFGDIICSNLEDNLKNTKLCEKCRKRIEKTNSKIKYCKQCSKEIEKENWVKRKRKQRKKNDVTK